jgi:hypothetical protein
MWQEVNEVRSGPKLVCIGCFCTHVLICTHTYSCTQEVMSGTYLFSYI